jgi:hypothetical protein
MLFLGGIDGIFSQKVHGLSAAYEFARSAMKNFNDIPA